jgi:hypothetical protein
MKIPSSLTTVTPLSKTLAAILFITLPFAGFYLGMQYEREIHPQGTDQPSVFEKLTCRKWKTVCDPNSLTDAGGCTPIRICIDHLTTPTIQPPIDPTSIPTQTPPQSRNPDDVPPISWDDAACTADAKMCPDGSYVSRQGPRCEFAPCPGAKN